MRINLLSDKGPADGIIKAITLAGEMFAERRVPVWNTRELRDCALRTLENDPYLGEVGAITPGCRRLVAVFKRDPIRRSL